MFRIECFVDDAKLAKIKWALFELGAYNVTDQPVADSKPNGHARTKSKNIQMGELVKAFFAYATKRKLKELRAQQVREFVTSIGFSEGSYSHVLTKLKDVGAVTKVPGNGSSNVIWRVTPSKIKKSVVAP